MTDKGTSYLFYSIVVGILLLLAIWMYIEDEYLDLPKYGETHFSEFIADNHFENAFINQDSLVVDIRHLMKDKEIILVDLFFTRCRSICPAVTQGVKQVLDKIEPSKKSKVLALSFSVDPENDVPSELLIYRERYEINDPQWVHITGRKGAIYKLIREQLNVSATPANQAEDDFIHSSQIVLLDKDKVIRGYYDGTDSTALATLSKHVLKLN